MSCCPDSPWSAEGGKGTGRERQNRGDAKVSTRRASERIRPPPAPRVAGRKQQGKGGKEDEGEREGGRLAGSSRLFTFLKLCSGATSSSQLSSARRR